MKKIWFYPVIFSALCGFLCPLAGPEFGNIFLAHLPTIIIFYFIICWSRVGRMIALFGSYALAEIYFGALHQYGVLDCSIGLLGILTCTMPIIFLSLLEELKSEGFKTINVTIQYVIIATGFVTALLLLGHDLDIFNSVIAKFNNYDQSYFATDAVKQLSASALSTTLLALPVVIIPTYILQKKTRSIAPIAHTSLACLLLFSINMTILPLIGALMIGVNPIHGTDMDKMIVGEAIKICLNEYILPISFLTAFSLILTRTLKTYLSYRKGENIRLWAAITNPTKKEPLS